MVPLLTHRVQGAPWASARIWAVRSDDDECLLLLKGQALGRGEGYCVMNLASVAGPETLGGILALSADVFG